jgi:hypothetical protein
MANRCDSHSLLIQSLQSLLPGLVFRIVLRLVQLFLTSIKQLLNDNRRRRENFSLLFLRMLAIHLFLIAKVLLHDPSVMIDLSFNLRVRSVFAVIEFFSLLGGND